MRKDNKRSDIGIMIVMAFDVLVAVVEAVVCAVVLEDVVVAARVPLINVPDLVSLLLVGIDTLPVVRTSLLAA